MAASFRRIGDDAHYVEATARVYGWDTAWERGRTSLQMTCGPWSVQVQFGSSGGFRSAFAQHDGGADQWLELAPLVTLLEHEGSVTRPAA